MKNLLYNLPKVIEDIIWDYYYQLIQSEEEYCEEDLYCDNCLFIAKTTTYTEIKIKQCQNCEEYLCYECYGENNIKEDICDNCFEKNCK